MTPMAGSWPSPISAEDVAAGAHPVEGGRFVGDEVWWLELRPSEAGRFAVRRQGPDGEPVDVLPVPWNARTRVHEYGGGAWTVTPGRAVVFAHFDDQRLYRLDDGATEPVALTPEPAQVAGLRYAELTLMPEPAGPAGAGGATGAVGSASSAGVWCVRESHDSSGHVSRDLCVVPLDGSAVADPSLIVSVVAGSDFLAFPRRSPEGGRLAWIAWNHPQMPWDGTELRVGDLDASGRVSTWRTVIGSTTESLLQPEWVDDSTLHVVSDRSGWWNLYRLRLGTAVGEDTFEALHPVEADLGAPLWRLGGRRFAPMPDGRLLTVRTLGIDTVAVLDPSDGSLRDVDLGDVSTVVLGALRDGTALITCGGARTPTALRRLDIATGRLELVRASQDGLPEQQWLSATETMSFDGPGGRVVHAMVSRPQHPDHAVDGPVPYVAFVHGGPTSHAGVLVSLDKAFFTSRGIGVVDVNYGGSSGYGRDYRERLRGEWGVVDVEDTVAVMAGLVATGLADPDRLAIRGGSAGGWTVLSALTTTDTFSCGTSYFGVAELVRFVADTHDFESRYIDGLVGPLPEARALYDSRAPVNNVAGLRCPVLLLQGLDDPIVPPSQAELFRDAMVSKGIEHAYVAYEGESHGFRRRETVVDSLQAELSFYGQVMGFETPGVPTLELWHPGG